MNPYRESARLPRKPRPKLKESLGMRIYNGFMVGIAVGACVELAVGIVLMILGK